MIVYPKQSAHQRQVLAGPNKFAAHRDPDLFREITPRGKTGEQYHVSKKSNRSQKSRNGHTSAARGWSKSNGRHAASKSELRGSNGQISKTKPKVVSNQTSLPTLRDLPSRPHYAVSSIHAHGNTVDRDSGADAYGRMPHANGHHRTHKHFVSPNVEEQTGRRTPLTPRDHQEQFNFMYNNVYRGEPGYEEARLQHFHREHLNSRQKKTRPALQPTEKSGSRRGSQGGRTSPGYQASANNPYYAADPVWRDQANTQETVAREAKTALELSQPHNNVQRSSKLLSLKKKRGYHDDSDSEEEGDTVYGHMMKKSDVHKHRHSEGHESHVFPSLDRKTSRISIDMDQEVATLFSIDDMEKAFEMIDHNHDGLIQKSELVDLMVVNGMPKNEARDHADGFFRICDVDDDGAIDFEEFVRDYVRMIIFRVLRLIQTKSLTFIDRDNDGEISRFELEDVFAMYLGRERAKLEVARIFDKMDTDGSGLVSWSELIAWYSTFSKEVRAQRKAMMQRNQLMSNVKQDKWGRQTKAWMADQINASLSDMHDVGKEIILRVACNNLPATDRFSDCDPMVALFAHSTKDFLGASFKAPMDAKHYIGRTEMMDDEPNPVFETPFHVILHPSMHQYLTFCLFDVTFRHIMVPDKSHPPMNEEDRIGYATINLRQLLGKVDRKQTLKLRHVNNHHTLDKPSMTISF